MSEVKQALLLNDTALAGNHGSQVVIDQLIRLAGQHGINIAGRQAMDTPLDQLQTRGLDLVIVNGEGSLHHAKKAARAIAAVPEWAETRGLPAFLINSIYQDNDDAILKGVSRYKQIYLRDAQSFKELEALGKTPQAVVDLSLTWGPVGRLAADRRAIIVTDSTLKDTNAALFALSRNLSDTVFVPFRSRPPVLSSNQDQNTANLNRYRMRKITSRFQTKAINRARYANILPTLDDFTQVLRNTASLIVAGRYHAVCIALDLQIPFVAVPSNSFKVEALLEAIGMQGRMVQKPLASITRQNLLSDYGSYTDGEQLRMSEFKQQQCATADRMFQEIHDHCQDKVETPIL